jgi:hypothetical protein
VQHLMVVTDADISEHSFPVGIADLVNAVNDSNVIFGCASLRFLCTPSNPLLSFQLMSP